MRRELWRTVKDRRQRLVFGAMAGLLCNLLYALYNGVLGVWNRSVWLVTLCAYYAILAVMRFAAVLYHRRDDGGDRFAARLTGWLLILLSLVLAGVTWLSLSQNTAVRYGTIVMITIATYTFTKITLAVIRAVKAKGDPSGTLASIRCIGYAEVAASVFALQKSMFVSFGGAGDEKAHLMNILTGSVVWLFVLILGVKMTRR